MHRPAAIPGFVALALVAAGCSAGGAPAGATSGGSTAPPATVAPATSLPTPASTPAPTPTPAALAPGEPWLAFQSGGSSGYGIYLVRPDGSDRRFPLRAVPAGAVAHPEWSPDGRTLLFTLTATGGTTEDIWIADTATWAAHRLVACEAPCARANEPAWSPDGSTIAFQRLAVTEGRGTATLELLDVSGGEPRVVLAAPADMELFAPRWSPDGRRLVVETMRRAGDRVDDALLGVGLSVVDVTASTPALATIVPFDRLANNPDWSPDGERIVFSAPAEGGEPGGKLSDLWTVRPDGTGIARVTDVAAGGGTAIHPAYTPDGERILLVLDDPAAGRMSVIASVRPDGSDLAPATPTSITGTHPRLRPTP